jgi:Base plate wedge protein 53
MFFSLFPKIPYNQNFGQFNTSVTLATDIFFRTKFREIIKNQNIAYYLYTVPDGETMEQLSEKYYGEATDYWIIAYANDIVNPYYDWVLSSRNFSEYIKEKYGSIQAAQTTIHHYNKVYTTRPSNTSETVSKSYEIDYEDPRTNIGEVLPYDDYTSLAVDYYPNVSGTFKDGTSAELVISRSEQSVYDWEFEKNEAKRNIKIIRKDYYPIIKKEMDDYRQEVLKSTYTREIRNY